MLTQTEQEQAEYDARRSALFAAEWQALEQSKTAEEREHAVALLLARVAGLSGGRRLNAAERARVMAVYEGAKREVTVLGRFRRAGRA